MFCETYEVLQDDKGTAGEKNARQYIWSERFYAARALVSGPKVKLVCLDANGRRNRSMNFFLFGDCFKDFYSLEDEFLSQYLRDNKPKL